MLFLKITDPKKRHITVIEFLKTRQNIQQNFLSERVVDLSTQYELSKLFKPITDMQTDLKEGLQSELNPIGEGMKNLPKAITFTQFPFITAHDDDGEKEEILTSNTCESLLPSPPLIRHLDCGIRMVRFTLGTMKQK